MTRPATPTLAALHDAYAATYDADVQAYDCHVAEVLFGLCYEYVEPSQRVLDAGAGTGLCGQLFARAGLAVHAMDISPALLELCRAKRFAASVSLHDMQDLPWPYPSGAFDHVVCCGVLHFIAVLDAIFGEVARILTGSGVFAFTTKAPARPDEGQDYERQASGSFEIYSHAPAYVRSLLARQGFALLKTQRCFVGDELFIAWVARRHAEARGSDAQ